MSLPPAPVLILGAGVNGISVARELVLNGVPVWMVDTNDIAFGATAKSSRLIHGGLRYLEYGDFHLVAESLHERDRLLRVAPQFVTPLRLHIPVRQRMGGFIAAGFRFLGLSGTRLGHWIGSGGGRGLMTVRFGLWLYDWLARSRMVPRHRVQRTGAGGPEFSPQQYPWSCAYFDAQMERPERFCIAMLKDIEAVARSQGTEFRVLTYHRAVLSGAGIEIQPVSGSPRPLTPTLSPTAKPVPKVASPVEERQPQFLASGSRSTPVLPPFPVAPSPLYLTPSLIINATGAWGDWTLQDLPVPAPPLFGGTKGTHLFTSHAGLAHALGGDAVYAEASDGRLVFLIPVESGVMIGTTDERFDERPELARSTEAEVAYLLQLTNELFPQVAITDASIQATCAGIRPLPNSQSSKTAAISRGHSIDERTVAGMPVLTLIGGKLTTCRALGEEVADRVLKQLGQPRMASTRDRIVPGGEGYPANLDAEINRLASVSGYAPESCWAMWRLMGTRIVDALDRESEAPAEPLTPDIARTGYGSAGASPSRLIPGTALPRDFVRQVIQIEWVTTLEDLVERRLLLALQPKLCRETLQSLAELLHEMQPGGHSIEEMVERASERLRVFYTRKDV